MALNFASIFSTNQIWEVYYRKIIKNTELTIPYFFYWDPKTQKHIDNNDNIDHTKKIESTIYVHACKLKRKIS